MPPISDPKSTPTADVEKLFSALGWTGLTVPEYLVLQRLLAEKNGDHRFDLYAPDTRGPSGSGSSIRAFPRAR